MLGIPGTLIPPSLLPSNLCPTLSSPPLFHSLLHSSSCFHRFPLSLSFFLFFYLSFFFFVRSTSIIFLSRRLFAREITFLCPDHCPLHLCFFVQQSFSLSLFLSTPPPVANISLVAFFRQCSIYYHPSRVASREFVDLYYFPRLSTFPFFCPRIRYFVIPENNKVLFMFYPRLLFYLLLKGDVNIEIKS